MKVFITGSEGFIGRELVLQCEKKHIEIITVDMVPSDRKNHHQADIRSKNIIDIIPEGIDAIIHLAGLTRDQDCKDKGYECFEANVMATLNLIDAAHKKKAKQFIFASSEWVYGDFKEGEIKDETTIIDISQLKSEYAFSKIVSETNLRQKYQYGFCPVTILRFGIVYGSRKANWSAVESIFNSVKTKDVVEIGCLKTGRCFIHVTDIVSGIISSIGLHGFNIIGLEGDKLITIKDIIDCSKEITKKNPKVIEKSPDNPNIRNVRNQAAKDMLDWTPEIELKEGLIKLDKFLLEK